MPGSPIRPPSAALVCALLGGALVPPSVARAQPDPLAPVAQEVARRDDEGALAALAALPRAVREGGRARYLRGRLLERLGRLGEAADAFPLDAAAAGLPDAARQDARRRAAVAFARSGRCERAAALFEGDADPLVAARAAECLLARGDPGAVDALRAVLGRGHAAVDLFAARFALAEALARRGDRAEAATELTALLVERPEHPEAERAQEALEGLNGGPTTLSFEQRMDRAERLAEVRRYDDALGELEGLARPTEPAALRRYLHTKGMALYQQRHRYEEAAAVLAESARLRGPHAEEDAFHAARALSRADRDTDAVRGYRAFALAHPGHRRAAEALYLAAWLEMRHGVRGGRRQMERFRRSAHGRSGRFAEEAAWQLALDAFEAGQHRRAEILFDRYGAMGSDPLVRGRGRYWVARARQARGDRRGAIAAYHEALYVEPLHWYALLSRQRLEALGEPSPPPFPEGPEPGASAPPAPASLPEDAAFYAALGLRRDAREALRAHERALRRDGPRALAEAYRRLGEPSRLVRLFGGASTTRRMHRPGPADRWRWDAAYPRPWAGRVGAAATTVHLRPAHLYAVMRQESGFDPDAVSYADAIGLMQLLPSTGARVAERLGVEVSREMLFDPAVNVRLGAAYVGELAGRFGIPLAFAAFNAGGHRVAAWLDERGRTELDLFVEHIPYQQTRNYVRRVTTHLAHYLYLEDPDGGWPLTLESHVAPATPDAAPPPTPRE